ncbi:MULTISPECIES: hypothetical protein [Streptomycetaceae]|uniref:Iron-sulfur protein n=1 Tax=Streptantibioticus cattleyicolor (strain ATCC 35852 / DSM 46488 / JCM 4925 / NBRC 14057 / NRRL 8057) TaxID=1003195 RepID=F8JXL6_STREN|nr:MULTISPECIES: hypothetical protein [Streptomycetaceae]AEW97118.1 hypothetical protein SCATT_47470 [Streptantibioticus cattleyicolor NRRL 8057 = DSM 46488]MYS61577.1 iron-sulfur protein [Streptomyces sp. SID5468]CCB77442.1 conserved protein of unknown function [Streptantibioticus cattleyicolor NRRL 8057 = DSM 46488]
MPVAARLSPSPLDAAYRRLARVTGVRVIRSPEAPPTGDGWLRGDSLAAGGAAPAAVSAAEAERLLRDHGRPARPDVAAGLALHRYAWPACLLFTVPWFWHRRVPWLAPGDVAVHRDAGRVAVRPGPFACLPGDPAAGLPGARPVAGEAALREALREAVAAHLGPVIEAFRPYTRRGRRALWGMACDEIAEGLWYVAGLAGEADRAAAELSALLPGDTPPYPGGAGFRVPEAEPEPEAGLPGGAALTRDRISCCLFYTVLPSASCTRCPRGADADRAPRVAAGA